MQVTKINLNDDIQLSRIVYGAWRLSDDANTSASHIANKIETCIDRGITSFDHADIYGDYECEPLFGKVLKQNPSLRRQIEIVAKTDIKLLSEKFPERRVKHYDTSAAHIKASVNQSLAKLETDYLDLLLLHRPDPLMDAAETGAALDGLIKDGKVRGVGVSNFKPSQIELLQANMTHPLLTNQIEINLLNRDSFTNGDLDYLQLKGIKPMAWSPLAAGEIFEHKNPAAIRLRPLLEKKAAKYKCTLDAVGIAWLLQHPANIIPVIGTNNMQRLAHIHDAMRVEFSRETWFQFWIAASGEELE